MSIPGAPAARASNGRRSAPVWPKDGWIAVAGPALIFLGHLLYGAMLPRTALGLAAAWSVLAIACLARPRPRRDLLRLTALGVPALLFAVVVAVALWSLTPFTPGGAHPVWAYLGISPGAASIDKSSTVIETLKLLALGVVFVVGAATGGRDPRARLAINSLVVFGGAFTAWALLQFAINRAATANRLEASFLTANTAGAVFAALFLIALGLAASRAGSAGRHRLSAAAPAGAAALVFLASMLLTASRGAFLAAAAGLIAFGALQLLAGRVRWSRALLVGGAATAAIMVLLAVSGDLLLTRMLGVGQGVTARTIIAGMHWNAFLTSPLMGFGLGSFDTVNRMLLDGGNFERVWSVRAAHNVYLGWLEQGGLLGAAPMFACIAAVVMTTVRRALRRTRTVNLILALVAVDVVFLGDGLTDFALEMFSVSAMWAYLLGLQFSLAQGSSAR